MYTTCRQRNNMIKELAFLFCIFLCSTAHSQATESPVILFDQFHMQQFFHEKDGPLQLSGLAGILQAQGAILRTGTEEIHLKNLGDVNALIISGAFQQFTGREITAILVFLKSGGKLALMTHIPIPYKDLLTQLGVSVSNGVIREVKNVVESNGQDFTVSDLTQHPLTENLEAFTIYGGWALLARNETVNSIARTSPGAWVDLNRNDVLDPLDARQSFAVILAGKLGLGNFIVFGDDALFQNRFLTDGNKTLAKNLAVWLCEESHARLTQGPP